MVWGRRGSSGSDPPRLDGGMERRREGRGGDGDGGFADIQVVQNKRFFSEVETNNRQ